MSAEPFHPEAVMLDTLVALSLVLNNHYYDPIRYCLLLGCTLLYEALM
jgi:hypothetical protein